MKKRAFTLIEMLVVIVLIGVVIGISVPAVRSITYQNSQKEYQTLEKLAYEASKQYIKSYQGEMNSTKSDCFNIPYETLLMEGLLEEENVTCSGNVIVERKNNTSNGNHYTYYLTCKDKNGKVVHENRETVPLKCLGFNGNFVVDYKLYQDNNHTTAYQEGDWSKYVYGTYSTKNPYNVEIDHYEYTKDLLNWNRLNSENQEYTNHSGNIYFRAVDKSENRSSVNNHIVKVDSTAPNFTLSNNEHSITSDNKMRVSITNVSDNASGVGVDKNGAIYSFDNGATWVKETSTSFVIPSEGTVLVKDKLSNVASVPVKTIYACSQGDGDATAAQVLKGKTAWVAGKKITGTMTNQGALNKTINPGESYTIPAGYHNGSGVVNASNLASNTSATATAAQILSGKTAWVNGNKITGTMRNFGDNWVWPNEDNGGKMVLEPYTYSNGTVENQMIAAYPRAGYFNGNTKVVIPDASIVSLKNITASQIVAGQKILGVTGTFSSDATATASDIEQGKTAYINGQKVTGTSKSYEEGYAEGEKSVINNLYGGSAENVTGSYTTGYSTGASANDSNHDRHVSTYTGQSQKIYLATLPNGNPGLLTSIKFNYSISYGTAMAEGHAGSNLQVKLKDCNGTQLGSVLNLNNANTSGSYSWTLSDIKTTCDYIYMDYYLYSIAWTDPGNPNSRGNASATISLPSYTYLKL